MPQINDVLNFSRKNFKKKSYRPWDLFDEGQPQKIHLENNQIEIVKTTLDQGIKGILEIPEGKKENNEEKINKQLGNELDNKKTTISKQLDNNNVSISKQLDNGKENDGKIHKWKSKQLGNELDNKKTTISKQLDNKEFKKTDQAELLACLTGYQKKLLLFIVEDCASRGLLKTNPITNEILRNLLNSDGNTVKTSIHRLILKGFIKRESGKRGKGGFTRYLISEEIRYLVSLEKSMLRTKENEHLESNKQMKSKQLGNEIDNNKETNKVTNDSSSSSYIKTTTTSQSNSWSLDIREFTKFGFNEKLLDQVIKLGLEEEFVKQSLIEFSYDFDNKHLPVIKTSIDRFLMGLFRRGVAYHSKHFVSDEEKVIQEMVKRAEERKQKMLDAKFMLWFHELSEEDKQNIQQNMMPSTRRQEMNYGLSDPMVKGHYLKYFMESKES